MLARRTPMSLRDSGQYYHEVLKRIPPRDLPAFEDEAMQERVWGGGAGACTTTSVAPPVPPGVVVDQGLSACRSSGPFENVGFPLKVRGVSDVRGLALLGLGAGLAP